MAVSLATIRTGVRIRPPKVVLYGCGGIGKTTWAAGAPKPVFLFTEDGQGMLDLPRFEIRDNDPILRSWEELMECVYILHTGEHDYQTVVIDTFDFAEPLLWKHTAKKYGKEDIEAFGYGKGYAYAVDEARILMGWLDALRRDRNMAVVILCHSTTQKYHNPDSESYDRFSLNLQERLSEFVRSWSDCLLFANYRTAITKDKEAFNQEHRRGIGQGERVVYTQERPAYWAKNRYELPLELPLSWSAFQEGIVVPETPTKKKK